MNEEQGWTRVEDIAALALELGGVPGFVPVGDGSEYAPVLLRIVRVDPADKLVLTVEPIGDDPDVGSFLCALRERDLRRLLDEPLEPGDLAEPLDLSELDDK